MGTIRLASVLVLMAGLVYSLYLQSFVTDDVFFGGDCGLKALMTRQFLSGQWRADLTLPREAWIEGLWRKGFYPFTPPFVYWRGERAYIQYPLWMSGLTAPLVALLGCHGWCVLPCIAILTLWLAFHRTCRSLGLDGMWAAFGLAVLIFSSPLTLYGAIFWEHAPAVCLFWLGLYAAWRQPRPSLPWLWAGGVSLGLSVWFREEMTLMILGLALCNGLRWNRRRAAYLCGIVVAVLPLVVLNLWLYGTPLGVHSLVATKWFTLGSKFTNAIAIFPILCRLLWQTYPMIVAAAACVVCGWRALGSTEKACLFLTLLFAPLVTLLFGPLDLGGDGGKQWGPRFWLPLIPLLALQTSLALRRLQAEKSWLGWLALACWLVGAYVNCWKGTNLLRQDYTSRVLPAIQLVRSANLSNVAISHQWIAQEMQAALPQTAFFLVDDKDKFRVLCDEAAAHGITRMLFLLPDYQNLMKQSLRGVKLVDQGMVGSYRAYMVLLDRN